MNERIQPFVTERIVNPRIIARFSRPTVILGDSPELTRQGQTKYSEGQTTMPDITSPDLGRFGRFKQAVRGGKGQKTPTSSTPSQSPEDTARAKQQEEFQKRVHKPGEPIGAKNREGELVDKAKNDPEVVARNLNGQKQGIPTEALRGREITGQEAEDYQRFQQLQRFDQTVALNQDATRRYLVDPQRPLPDALPPTTPAPVQELYQRILSQDAQQLFDLPHLQESVRELAGMLPQVNAMPNANERQQARNVIEDMVTIVKREITTAHEQAEARHRRGTLYGERPLTDREINLIIMNPLVAELVLERLFNRMFDRTIPQQRTDFQTAMGSAGQKEWSDFQRFLNDSLNPDENPWIDPQFMRRPEDLGPGATDQQIDEEIDKRKNILRVRISHYTDLYNTRRMLHDVNYAVLANIGTEKLVGAIGAFQSGYADMVFRKRGVQEAYRFYTQALLKIRSRYGGFIPETALINDPTNPFVRGGGEVDRLAREQFASAMRAGIITDPKTGESVQMGEDEIDAAFQYARGLGIMLGTTTEIAATSIIPKENPFVGLFAQAIVEKMQVYRTIHKYDIGGKGNTALGMLLSREGRWTRDEFEDWKHWKDEDQAPKTYAIMNGLLEEEGKSDRLIEMLNIFEQGGLVSRTTWRAGDDPVVGSLGRLTENDRDWVGPGLLIEKNRGDLSSSDRGKRQRAEQTIRQQLQRMSRIQPVALYNNVREVQTKVLEEMFGNDFRQLKTMLVDPGRVEDVRTIDTKMYDDYLKYRTKYRINGREIEGWDEGLLQTLKGTELYKNSNPIDDQHPFDPNNFRHRVDSLVQRLTNISMTVSVLQEAALQRRVETFAQLDRPDYTENRKVYKSDGSWEEKPFVFRRIDLNPQDPQERQKMQDTLLFSESVQRHFNSNSYIGLLRDRSYKQPFILDVTGMDNHEIFWQNAGDKAIYRRWNDMMVVETGSQTVIDFVTKLKTYKSPEEVAEGLQAIFDAVKAYDSGVAKDITKKLGEAAIKFYSKDWYYRLPGFVGGTLGLTKGVKDGVSWSQAVLGTEAMAWDEIDANRFTTIMRSHGTWAIEDQREVQSKTIASRRKVIGAYARFIIPLIAAGVLFYIMKQSVEDQI